MILCTYILLSMFPPICMYTESFFFSFIFIIGRRLAELELYVLLSKIIPKFHISTEMKELKLVQKTVLTTDNPVKLKLTPR